MTLRSILFWPHLVAGVAAGAVILVMCATGTLLMFERQLIAWSDSGYRSVVPVAGAARAPMATILAATSSDGRALTPTSVAIASPADAPVTVVSGGKTVYLDAYSGVVLGEAATGVRRAMRTLREWHRWLGAQGDGRTVGRAITGWATVVFAFIVVSGAYLWIPRSRAQLHAVSFLRGRLRGKARDFNWHNVLGVWACVPLFIVAVSAWPISFAWANAAVYRAMGEPVPAGRSGGDSAERGGQRAQARREGGRNRQSRDAAADARPGEPRWREAAAADPAASLDAQTLDALLRRAQRQEPRWKTITVRWPTSPSAPVQLAIDRSDGGRPQARSTLTLTRAGEMVSYETFATQTPGRRLRSVLRFAHTGEVLGLPGQVIAGVASAAGTVLVWTGLALACRRSAGWIRRRRRLRPVISDGAVDTAA